jgi:hypothetical protein
VGFKVTSKTLKYVLQVTKHNELKKGLPTALLKYWNLKVVPDSSHHSAVRTDLQSYQCSLAVLVVWFVFHRIISVLKVKFLKLEILRILIR